MTGNNRANSSALLLQPESVMLPDIRLVNVVVRQFDVLEAVPRAIELAPEIEVAQHRLAFE